MANINLTEASRVPIEDHFVCSIEIMFDKKLRTKRAFFEKQILVNIKLKVSFNRFKVIISLVLLTTNDRKLME